MRAALEREVREEVGLQVSIGDVFYADEWRPAINGKKLQIFGIFFRCSALSKTVVLTSDHDEHAWIEKSEARQYDLMPQNKKALEIF